MCLKWQRRFLRLISRHCNSTSTRDESNAFGKHLNVGIKFVQKFRQVESRCYRICKRMCNTLSSWKKARNFFTWSFSGESNSVYLHKKFWTKYLIQVTVMEIFKFIVQEILESDVNIYHDIFTKWVTILSYIMFILLDMIFD